MAEQFTSNKNVLHVDFANQKTKSKASDYVAPLSAWAKKREIFSQMLSCGTVCLTIDATMANVKVPPAYCKQQNLRLNFCYQFHIPDFNFNDVSVWATLEFGSQGDFFCSIPWEAIYAIQSLSTGEMAFWDADDSFIEIKTDANEDLVECIPVSEKVIPINFFQTDDKG